MRDFELPPREEDDVHGRDRGQRNLAEVQAEMREWDELWAEVTDAHAPANVCWECRNAEDWLS